MPNITRSGYLAAATAVTWASGTTLNSLANNGWTSLSDEIDNSTNKYMFADVELVLGSAAFTGTLSSVELYLVPTVDGTNYPNWSTGTNDLGAQAQYAAGIFVTTAATAAQRSIVRDVALPPGKYRWGFRSRAGVTLAASGNSVNWRPHSLSV